MKRPSSCSDRCPLHFLFLEDNIFDIKNTTIQQATCEEEPAVGLGHRMERVDIGLDLAMTIDFDKKLKRSLV